MLIHIDQKSQTPIYEQIIKQIKELKVKGILQVNEKLPSVRELSSTLLVNPNTVSKAYQELERQEVIVTLRGKGTFISDQPVSNFDSKKAEELQTALKQILIEARYYNITKEQILQWLDEQYKELGGETDAEG
ncbi:GntR family transcriptional regulator [Chengkuizengella axinellae]|uniref:GntR family transcriptional regulator n=1 Tax=Chengkuizengella axinellae TaxID=3064388 RepID=A0ABT9IXN0_9BACL|nr:GntR family transcriptional regulator [Chengkuizengella sp. 2205SS18-9]MDP5274118.1 GntR family transcriptional regulator [Chengkuizengella sp. 2205SS18-9]